MHCKGQLRATKFARRVWYCKAELDQFLAVKTEEIYDYTCAPTESVAYWPTGAVARGGLWPAEGKEVLSWRLKRLEYIANTIIRFPQTNLANHCQKANGRGQRKKRDWICHKGLKTIKI